MRDLTPILANGAATADRRPQSEIQRRGAALRIFGSARAIAMIAQVKGAAGEARYLILIDETVAGWRYDDALRHELRHIVAGPHWHAVR